MRRCSAVTDAARHAEHLGGGALVDVLARAERVAGTPGPREKCARIAQLDLRVVGRRPAACPGSATNACADAPADLGADRDVLEVRIARRQPPGRGDRLVERRVQAPGRGVDQRRQRVDVGPLQLRQRAVVDDLRAAPGAASPAPRARRRPSTARSWCLRTTGSASLPNSTSASCLGELMLNGPPAMRVDLRLERGQLTRRPPGRSRAAGRCRAGCRGTRSWPARARAAAPSCGTEPSSPAAASSPPGAPPARAPRAASAPRRAADLLDGDVAARASPTRPSPSSWRGWRSRGTPSLPPTTSRS